MSVAFNGGASGVPLARMIAAFFVSSKRPSGAGLGQQTRQRAVALLTPGQQQSDRIDRMLWRADEQGQGLDITSAHNSKVKLIRYVFVLQ